MFAFIYLELVKKFMGDTSYHILKNGYKNFNVKYRNRIPQTSAKEDTKERLKVIKSKCIIFIFCVRQNN